MKNKKLPTASKIDILLITSYILLVAIVISIISLSYILGYKTGNPCSFNELHGRENKSEECLTFLFNNIDSE